MMPGLEAWRDGSLVLWGGGGWGGCSGKALLPDRMASTGQLSMPGTLEASMDIARAASARRKLSSKLKAASA